MKKNRAHYRKYFQVQERLIEHLEAGLSAKESAKELGISLPTFYKYKSIASIENDTLYMTAEEKSHVARLRLIVGAFGHSMLNPVKHVRHSE